MATQGSASIRELRERARALLAADDAEHGRAASDTPQLDADILLCEVLATERTELFTRLSEAVRPEQADQFLRLVHRRLNHEPIAYLTGKREFFGYTFHVGPEVLIPRPETELLVTEALKFLGKLDQSRPYLWDVCTGSGAVICAIIRSIIEQGGTEHRMPRLAVGSDISARALAIARKNSVALGVAEKLHLVRANLLAPAQLDRAEPLVITCNPPYVPAGAELAKTVEAFEPELALRGGIDGLHVIKRLLEMIRPLLAHRGRVLLMEIGHDQHEKVEELLAAANLPDYYFCGDLQGYRRVVVVGDVS